MIFTKSLIANPPIGGILIIPINFISSFRKQDLELRKDFLKKFSIPVLNIFEEPVFQDTSYSVISFEFTENKIKNTIINFYPSKEQIVVDSLLHIGENFLKSLEKVENKFKISRVVQGKNTLNTQILVKCIDDETKINAKIVEEKECFIDTTKNHSARSYCSLEILPKISLEKQEKVVEKFNRILGINIILFF